MKVKERGTPRHEVLRKLLKQKRQAIEITQRDLATRLGWDHKSISNIERGSKRVTVLEFLDLAEALGFDAVSAMKRLRRR